MMLGETPVFPLQYRLIPPVYGRAFAAVVIFFLKKPLQALQEDEKMDGPAAEEIVHEDVLAKKSWRRFPQVVDQPLYDCIEAQTPCEEQDRYSCFRSKPIEDLQTKRKQLEILPTGRGLYCCGAVCRVAFSRLGSINPELREQGRLALYEPLLF